MKKIKYCLFDFDGAVVEGGGELLKSGIKSLWERLTDEGCQIVFLSQIDVAEPESVLANAGFDVTYRNITYGEVSALDFSCVLDKIGAMAEETVLFSCNANVIREAKREKIYSVGIKDSKTGNMLDELIRISDSYVRQYSELAAIERNIPLNRVSLELGGGRLWQISNRSYMQMMSYIIDTPNGDTIVIDGGNRLPDDAKNLKRLIDERGGRVDLWIMTHAHSDHFGSLLWLMEQETFDINIEKLCFRFPPIEWFKDKENGDAYRELSALYSALERRGIAYHDLIRGQTIACGGIEIEVLGDCSNYENYSTVNDTTIALKAHFPKRDVLFLGDLAVDGGKDLLRYCPAEKLRCDIVQMAHHGQGGVKKDFYEHICPKICLYTTPDWLWDNDEGNGKDTGPYKTLETRHWMEELNAQASFPCAYGDYLFE